MGFTDKEYSMFQKIVSAKQSTLHKAIDEYLKRRYEKVYSCKDYIFAYGDIPVALVAHLDTVFAEPAYEVYYDREKETLWSPQGLGADDRAGVFGIITLIKRGYHPHIILTTDEELGAIGAQKFIAENPKPFVDIKYIIQLDRRGVDDCVFYDCGNEGFINYVESFDFTQAYGTFSDISVICPAWEVAGVNLSIGYINEHSHIETFHVLPFLATVNKVAKMLDDINNASYFKYISSPNGVKWWSEEIKCAKCGKHFNEYEMFPVKSLDRKTKFFCPECLISNAEWCERCNEAFEIEPNSNKKYCKDCEEQMVACRV